MKLQKIILCVAVALAACGASLGLLEIGNYLRTAFEPVRTDVKLKPVPAPTPTPLDGTWQEQNLPNGTTQPSNSKTDKSMVEKVTVMICPLSGMRATANCPTKESKVFKKGEEPQDFCTFHTGN